MLERLAAQPQELNTPPTYPQIEGTLQIREHHFFDVQVHLKVLANKNELTSLYYSMGFHNSLSNNTEDNQLSAPIGLQYVILNSQRRMRSNQLNYIDHPLIGMLIKLIPVS